MRRDDIFIDLRIPCTSCREEEYKQPIRFSRTLIEKDPEKFGTILMREISRIEEIVMPCSRCRRLSSSVSKFIAGEDIPKNSPCRNQSRV